MDSNEEDEYNTSLEFGIVTYLVGACVVLVNTSIAMAFLIQRLRQRARLTPGGLLVLNLVLSDAFIGAIIIIMTATQKQDNARYPNWCLGRVAITYLGLIGSHVALVNVVVDRYVAIMHTLRYRDWMTIKRSGCMVGAGWLVPVTGAVGALLSNNWRPGLSLCSEIAGFRSFLSFVWIPSHLLALTIVIGVQYRMYLYLKHQEETPATIIVLRRYSDRSAQVLHRVAITFVVCWGPFDVLLLTDIFFPNPIVKMVYKATSVLAYLSFLVNPCLFSYKTESIRRPVSALYQELKEALIGKAVTDVDPNKIGTHERASTITRNTGTSTSTS